MGRTLRNLRLDRESRELALWASLILSANLLDALTTTLGIRLGLSEANPLIEYVLGHGLLALALLKISVSAVVISLVTVYRDRYPGLWRLFRVLTLLTLLIAISNWASILGIYAQSA